MFEVLGAAAWRVTCNHRLVPWADLWQCVNTNQAARLGRTGTTIEVQELTALLISESTRELALGNRDQVIKIQRPHTRMMPSSPVETSRSPSWLNCTLNADTA